ncbi:MAG: site-specific DNA-methyltransferase [Planctomycetaceae bacterium]|nr:site-specific DNA-methyltransferase [Planctomycetaceae bacterium]
MAQLPAGCIDLAFADPPFNIGYKYDVYDDRKAADDYLSWCHEWIAGVHRVLKPNGAFWLAIGDEFAAELKVMAQREIGFFCRSWVIWYYTFGVNCTKKFNRSHAHLFYFVKDPKQFTFNAHDPAIRVPSARQLVYADGRANPKGRLPDDTWILRPQDLENGFSADSDTWYFPRVAGTFKERAGFHGCQMPERLLGRIIAACSNPGDKVLDPFAGSGTTLAVAKKLGRSWIGFELSAEYATRVDARLKGIAVGQELDGAIDPLKSAPATKNGKRRRSSPIASAERTNSPTQIVAVNASAVVRRVHDQGNSDRSLIREAYQLASQGWSTERVITDPELQDAFVENCRRLGVCGGPETWNRLLTRMRKEGDSGLKASRQERANYAELCRYLFAAEIAWKRSSVEGRSLDDILCNPAWAASFDEIAQSVAPGFSPFEYRTAALYLRKSNRFAKRGLHVKRTIRFENTNLFKGKIDHELSGMPGLFLLRARGVNLFVGNTSDLLATSQQLRRLRENCDSLVHQAKELWAMSLKGFTTAKQFESKGRAVALNRPRDNYELSEGLSCG